MKRLVRLTDGRRTAWTGLALIVLGLVPLVLLWATLTTASALDCDILESPAGPCIVAGSNLAPALYRLSTAFYVLSYSATFGLVLIGLGLLAVAMLRLILKRLRG